MSLDTFNNSGMGVSGSSASAPVGSDAPAPAGHKGSSQVDSLSTAEQEALVSMMMAGFPLLPAPNTSTIAFESEEKLSKISENMLNSWTESLALQSAELQAYLNSTAYQTWQHEHSASGAANDKLHIPPSAVVSSKEFIDWDAKHRDAIGDDSPLLGNLSSFLNKVGQNDPAAVGALPFVMVNFIVPGALVSGVVDTVSTSQVSVNPVVDTSFFSNISSSSSIPIQDSMRAELAMIGGIFAAGALNYSEAINTAEAVGGKKEHSNKNLALNYGEKVLSLVNNQNFDNFLSGMFASKIDKSGNSLNPAQLNERVGIFKMVLLATALMAIYSSEAKYISQGDFEGMINGTTTPRSKTEANLVASFQSIRDSGMVSGDVFQSLVAGLGSYAGKNPNFSSFFKVDNAFAAISQRNKVTNDANAAVPTSSPI